MSNKGRPHGPCTWRHMQMQFECILEDSNRKQHLESHPMSQ
jgi:hypothetical protein